MAAETRIVELEGPAVAREQLVNIFPCQPKHVSLAMDMHITIQEWLEAAFSMWSILGESRHRIGQIPCGGGVEYLHCSPASRGTHRKENPVPGGITGPTCSWGDINMGA
jgi:hypothetical protein